MRNLSRSTLLTAAASLVLLAIGFGSGFEAHRHAASRLFLRRVAIRLGWLHVSDNRAPVEVESPSLPANVLSLPYVAGTIDPDRRRGVVAYDQSRAFDGVNFYTSVGGVAQLVDMHGRTLYRWSNPVLAPAQWHGTNSFWEYSHLFPDGRILAVRVNGDLVELDRDSRVLWTVPGRFHHDLAVAENGDIYALAWDAHIIPELHSRLPTLIDQLLIVSADGRVKRKISLLDVFRRSRYAFLMPSYRDLQVEGGPLRELDPLHVNHVEIVGPGAPFPRGSLLMGMRNIHAILVLDPSLEHILWLWGPSNLSFQHHPTLLPNGHILIFDNGTEHSQLIEVDPRSNTITWRFAPPTGFFSPARGSAQRLANGDTLITESDRGNVFEITPAGTVVWRFQNPDINDAGLRSAIFRMERLNPADLRFLSSTRRQ